MTLAQWTTTPMVDTPEGATERNDRACGCTVEAHRVGYDLRVVFHPCDTPGHTLATVRARSRYYIDLFTLPPDARAVESIAEMFEDALAEPTGPREAWFTLNYMILAAVETVPSETLTGTRPRRCADCAGNVVAPVQALTAMLTQPYVILCNRCATARTMFHGDMGWTHYVAPRREDPRRRLPRHPPPPVS